MTVGGTSQRSDQFARSQSFIAPMQERFLGDMFSQAQNATDPGAAQGAARQASQFSLPLLQQGMASTAALGNPAAQIAAQDASLQAGLGQMFREEINPALESNAIAAGGFGGGRQGVAQGVAAGQLANAYTQARGDIVANANRTALGANQMLPGMAASYLANTMAPQNAGLDQLGLLSQILGSPTVLSKQRAGQKSRQGSFNLGLPFG